MTDATGPAGDAPRLPPHPRDAHLAAAGAMLRRLSDAFPRAGLGITGSVATGTHGPESDVDLVAVDASFRREAQFATVSEGVRTAIVCLHPDFDEARERRWMLAAGGDVKLVSMVRSAFVARDPAGFLARMQGTVARLDAERPGRRGELVSILHDRALSAVRALHDGTTARAEHLQMTLFTAVVDAWFLQRGLSMDTRRESERMLETVAARDPGLAALLYRAVPLTHAATAPLLRAFDYVFAPQGARP